MTPEAPPIHEGSLTRAQLDDYRRDLEALSRVLAVLPKRGARSYAAGEQPSLADGLRLLADGQLRGLQVRYLFDGQEWWDTLLATGETVRIVRVNQSAVSAPKRP
jgi:hypothetical protein